jgi:putative Mg2+ transporter-C (MgtC) family protein
VTEFDHVAEIAIRLCIATILGGLLGLNRDMHGKPAGIRTLGLVSLGSALVTLAVLNFDPSHPMPTDAISRVVQGVLAGVGFLGAGVIMRDDTGHVHRLNTAASIWVTAALGLTCGLGAWIPAAIATILVFALLTLGMRFDHNFFGRLEKPHPPKD